MKSAVAFSVRIKRSAARELEAIPQPARPRLAEAIDSLGDQPFQSSTLKRQLRGLRRLRVGDYRVIYELLDSELVVLAARVAHRQGAYGGG